MKALYKKHLQNFCMVLVLLFGVFMSCAELNVPSPTVFQDKDVFANETSLMAYLARMYSRMPFEDFRYSVRRQFFDDWLAIPDACSGQCFERDAPGWFLTREGDQRNNEYWAEAFGLIRDANVLLETLPKYQQNFTPAFYSHSIGEAYFVRAFVNYSMIKRYGGIPLALKVMTYPDQTPAELEIPRSTEAQCWDQVLADFNEAIKYLSDVSPQVGLASKNIALAFKSEAMLYAGTEAKYNKQTGFGQKTGVRVIGFDPGTEATYSKKYLQEAYNAAREIMKKGKFSLYKKSWSPGDPQAQFQNMQDMFFDSNSPENIYCMEYALNYKVHGYDVYAVPLQLRGAGYSCEANPILDFVEKYDGLPKNPDGTIKVFDKDPSDPTRKYLLFDSPMDLFKNAEPRLRAYVCFPMDVMKGEVIDIRRGVYTADVTNGISPLLVQNGKEVYDAAPGPAYSSCDAAQGKGAFTTKSLFTGVHGDNNKVPIKIKWKDGRDTTVNSSGLSGPFDDALGANGGFTIRKWINPNLPTSGVLEGRMVQHFVLMRYAEVLLNAAEAACELAIAGVAAPAGDNFADIATQAIVDIRERAGADPLVGKLTMDETGKMLIRKERQKELAYENHNLWDIRRWRTQHSDVVNGRTGANGIYYRGLYPFYSEKAGKYFFDVRLEEHNWMYKLQEVEYYLAIPDGEVSKSTVIDQQPFR